MKTVPEMIQEISPYYQKKKKPEAEHKIIYDSPIDTLEPLYFWTIDLMNDLGLKTEKLVDNFVSAPGSGHFAELGQRATIMQQQASKTLADINTVLRSVLNIIYDLKEFRIRLQHYEALHSNDNAKKEAAILALKQIWMDKVDIQKGNSSIKAMALSQAGFQTLINAFLSVRDEKNIDTLDLNDMVKRILRPRVQEFNMWVKESEKELKKRYELEKNYLRSQVNSLKLYSRWAKPYLKAAHQLEMKESGKNPALVKTFNTILLELSLLGKSKITPPPELGKLKKTRKYYKCVLVDFYFRGIPQKIQPHQSHYTFGGRTEITFRAYALNEDELKKLDEEIDKSDIGDVLELIEGVTTESLKKLQEEIDFFLDEKEEEEKNKDKPKDTSNPFLALIGFYNKKEKKPEKKKNKDEKINPDNWTEATHVRQIAINEAKEIAFKLFDVYKKAHGMASFT